MSDEDRIDYKHDKFVKLTVGVCYLGNYFQDDDQGTVSKAKDMLDEHGIKLDLWPDYGRKVSQVNTIPFYDRLVEPDDYKDLYKEVKAILSRRCTFVVPLPVLYCNFRDTAHGITVPIKDALAPMILISPVPNDDRVTLLHEMGHAANLNHDKRSTDPRNFMREDEPRKTIFKFQVQKLARAAFAVG